MHEQMLDLTVSLWDEVDDEESPHPATARRD
jgi:hypothetical protein